MKDIVEDIIVKLDMHLLSITDFPVGLESRVQKLIKFLDDQSGRGCVIGIWGMGGLGKTTMAKSIYNKFRRQKFRRSFIETNNKGHTDLQVKLLSDVLQTKVKIHSVWLNPNLNAIYNFCNCFTLTNLHMKQFSSSTFLLQTFNYFQSVKY